MHRTSAPLALALCAAVAACQGIVTEVGGGAGDGYGEPPDIVPGERCEDERPIPRQLRLLTRREYANTVRDLVGIDVDTASIPVEARVRGFDNNAAAMVITSRHMDAYLALAEQVAGAAVAQQRALILPCDAAAPACARQFVTELGLRAFRRPLTTEEIDAYAAAFDGETFDDGMTIALGAMLISPSFLYRWEIGELEGNFARLTPYETASALSYLFWGTMPDDALFAAAAAGELRTSEQITAQARRLLADDRARDQVAEFVAQWMRTDGLVGAKDQTIYPAFTDSIRDAMTEELRRFVADVVFDQDGTFADLFVADYTIANAELAQYYGLQAPASGFAPVSVTPDSGRGGLLAMGAVLASHAHSNESSPIKRGVFVRERLLCQPLAPPPPNVDATPPGLDPSLTTRERFAQHTSDPACSGCHQLIDGIGFGFEGFDGAGARRLVENGLPVDTSGEIVGIDGPGTTDVPFDDVPELASIVAGSETAQACLPRQYFRFARGLDDTVDDSCAVHNLGLDFADAELSILELLVAVTGQQTFTLRRAN